MENITFKNVTNTHIQKCFLAALNNYPRLKSHDLQLIQRPIPETTMRAQPIFNAAFWNPSKRAYKVEISNHTKLESFIKIAELPANVLIGWFAHELGHVMDYLDRSGWNLIRFGLGYYFFPTFRMGAERKADLYAIQANFAKEIIETKTFILEHYEMPNVYKDRIRKYYMSPQEVGLLIEGQEEGIMLDQLI